MDLVAYAYVLFLSLFVLTLSSSAQDPSSVATETSSAQATAVEWGPWWVLLPFAHKSGVQGIDEPYAPEKRVRAQRAGSRGPKLDAKFLGRGKNKITWQQVRPSTLSAPDFGHVDFLALVPQGVFTSKQAACDNAVAYAYRSLTSPRAQDLDVSFGSDDSCRIWLNGKLMHDLVVARSMDVDSDRLTLRLKKGVNHLFVKVSNGGGGWGLQMRPRRINAGEPDAARVSQVAINAAIERGVVYLLQTQQLDGSWGFKADGFRNGQTSLASYALLKSGLAADHPAVRRALAYLAAVPPTKTYSLVCQMLAMHSTKRPADRLLLQQLGAELEDWENLAFGYPLGEPDLSNTQYGALGLWLATMEGLNVSKRTWKRVLRLAFDSQNEDGGFGYRAGARSTGSMTVAGLTVIRVGQLALQREGMPASLRNEAARSMAVGMDWLVRNFRADRNPKGGGVAGPWTYYYLYGVERLAALMGLEKIGNADWYQEGARFLVGAQKEAGSWGSTVGEYESNTAFALLFLSRGTAATTGGLATSRHQRTYATDGEGAQVVLRATGDMPLNLWVSGFGAHAVQGHTRDGEGGRGVYVSHVEYLWDGKVIQRVQADSARPWNQERFAFQYRSARRGEHELEVRVHLAPDERGGAAGVLSSPKLKVRIDGLLERWMMEYPDSELKNLVLEQDAMARASSTLGHGHSAAGAIDGLMGTGWACAQTDGSPTLTIEFARAVRTDRILLSHRVSGELWRGHFDRATRVELSVNGKAPLEFEMDPNEEHKTECPLPKPARISKLRIRVLERLPGSLHPGSVGFAEVELRLGGS